MVFYTHHGDVENTPLYPFGHGLSYSTFSYSDMTLDKKFILETEKINISVKVSNTSDVDGEEVAQLYIQDVIGSITRPILELKDFKKIMIKAGESKMVTFAITAEDLAFYRKDFTYGTEPGEFKVFIGSNSKDLQEDKFDLLDIPN